MKDDANKYNEVIDAEFISDSKSNYTESTPSEHETSELIIEQDINQHYTSNEFYSNMGQDAKFNSFSWSFSNNPNMTFKKPSLLKIIFFIPIILLFLSIFIVFALIAFVIFLPKMFLVLKRKGISGLKMDYKMIRGLFERFKMK